MCQGASLMKNQIRLRSDTFVRHVADESILWCPHTGGCTIIRNAKVILEELVREWREISSIVQAIASKCGCAEDVVAEDVKAIVEELERQCFVDVKLRGGANSRSEEEGSICTFNLDETWTPLYDFYKKHGQPSELHMDLTDCCNERCVHCYLPKGGAHFLDTDIALNVLKEFRDAQGLTLFLSGGECMLHRNFDSILRCAKMLDLNIVILSNLTLCDDETVSLLKEIDPQFVNVSLYAVDETIHDSITQVPGSCRKTKEAIDALQAVGVHVRIATPFMHENRACVEELREYASQHHVHLVSDCEIFGQTDHSCANQSHALSLCELKEIISMHKEVFTKGCLESERCVPDAKVCDIGEARLNLDAQGKYYPCDGFHGAIIGDAQKDALWDVWTGEALNRLRSLKNKDFGECAFCADRAWCKVCPMRNFNETGDMFTHASWRCEATRIYRRIFEERQPC